MNKLFVQKLIGAIALGSLLLPTVVAAAERQARPADNAKAPVTAVRNFCTLVGAADGEKVQQRLTNQTRQMEQTREKRDERLTERQAKRDEQQTQLRTKGDNRHEAILAKLTEAAATDVKRQALQAFWLQTQAAVTARRAAADAIQATYRSGLDQLIKNRQQTIDDANATFKSAVLAAETAAKNSCAATGAEPAKIRMTYLADVKAAKDQHAVVLRAMQNTGEQVKALVQQRQAAAETAHQTFKATMEQARVALKAAWGQTTSDNDADESEAAEPNVADE